MLEQFQQWLVTQGVAWDAPSTKLAVATDGPWDMARFLLMQCSVRVPDGLSLYITLIISYICIQVSILYGVQNVLVFKVMF